jgi:hypothetical protein
MRTGELFRNSQTVYIGELLKHMFQVDNNALFCVLSIVSRCDGDWKCLVWFTSSGL